MNRAIELYSSDKKNLLSIYFTAGFPDMESIAPIIRTLQKSGVDIIEIGIPFSDPVADGTVIQFSGMQAIQNGFSLNRLFTLLDTLKDEIYVPIYLMSYFNPVYQFGMESYLKRCMEVGISGSIIPDLPLEVYIDRYKPMFDQFHQIPMFLISPNTPEERFIKIVNQSPAFVYLVSSHSVTGSDVKKVIISNAFRKHYEKLNLHQKALVGFGIKDARSFQEACQIGRGGIIGTAFIRHIMDNGVSEQSIVRFINSIRNDV